MMIVFRFEIASYRSNFVPELPGRFGVKGQRRARALGKALGLRCPNAAAKRTERVMRLNMPLYTGALTGNLSVQSLQGLNAQLAP